MSLYLGLENDTINALIAQAKREDAGSEVGALLISDTIPMQSAAGWYAGDFCVEKMDDGQWFPQPYSRESGYFSTREEALAWIG